VGFLGIFFVDKSALSPSKHLDQNPRDELNPIKYFVFIF
jgi:hypothetical protein